NRERSCRCLSQQPRQFLVATTVFRSHKLTESIDPHFPVRCVIGHATQNNEAIGDGEAIIRSGAISVKWFRGVFGNSSAGTVRKIITDPLLRFAFALSWPSSFVHHHTVLPSIVIEQFRSSPVSDHQSVRRRIRWGVTTPAVLSL